MELSTAIRLIRFHPLPTTPVAWADLGCGTGLFTQALASLLPSGSTIYAVDRNREALQQLQQPTGMVLEKIQADFTKDSLTFRFLDGVLMANSLHFVKDKNAFIQRIATCCKPSHRLLIVEYDTEVANNWVPYPLSFTGLQALYQQKGYTAVQKIYATPSAYNRAEIYGAVAESGLQPATGS